MAVIAHRYEFGEVESPSLVDRMIEGLAQGAVMATRAWISAVEDAPHPAEAFTAYDPIPPCVPGDPRCQAVRVGVAAINRAATCLDIAIYTAAWLQAREGLRDQAWVALRRPDGPDQYAHAVVLICPAELDDMHELDPTVDLPRKDS